MNNTSSIVAADGHVHLYPAYDLEALFRHLILNLDRLAGLGRPAGHEALDHRIHKLAFLAESRDNDFFGRLQNRDTSIVDHNFEIINGPDPVCVTVVLPGVGQVCLVAGRQIVTHERLEILGLSMRAKIPDGLPARNVIQQVVDAGGIPVLAWSPGKWLLARRHVVWDLIAGDQAQVLRLGDTTLRPTLWPEPGPMRRAHAAGRPVIPGSDPLPLSGEERYAGTYGFVYQGPFDVSQPTASIARMLAGYPATIMPAGARCGALDAGRRLYQLHKKNN